MGRNYFVFKTQISFKIESDDIEIDPTSITNNLQLNPSRFHRKGDTFIGKNSGSICTHLHTVWTIDSEWTVLKEETVSHHIKYFKEIFLPKIDILRKYKEDERFDVSFWISIETDYAGIGLYMENKEIAFLNDLSNWVHFSFSTNDPSLIEGCSTKTKL